MVNLSWKSHRDLFLLKMRLLGARPGLFYKRNGPLVTAAQGPGAVKQCIFSQWGKVLWEWRTREEQWEGRNRQISQLGLSCLSDL